MNPRVSTFGVRPDRIGRERSYALGSAALVIGIFVITDASVANQPWILYLFPPFPALGFSSRQSLYPTIAADLFHGTSFGAIIGVRSLFIGADAGIGPWAGGLIYDLSGSYRYAFWIAQILAFLSACCIWMIRPGKYRHQFDV